MGLAYGGRLQGHAGGEHSSPARAFRGRVVEGRAMGWGSEVGSRTTTPIRVTDRTDQSWTTTLGGRRGHGRRLQHGAPGHSPLPVPRRVQRAQPNPGRLYRSRKREERLGRHRVRIDENVRRVDSRTIHVPGVGKLRTRCSAGRLYGMVWYGGLAHAGVNLSRPIYN